MEPGHTMRYQRSPSEKRLGMNSVPLGTMDTNNDSFSTISNSEAELIDKVMLFGSDADCNYLNLIADCIPDVSPSQPAEDNSCSVEVISDTCEVHKYYTDTATAVVDNHFIRSLFAQNFEKMNETASIKKTGASKRKAKRKPTVTSLMPSRAHVTTDARVHPYTFMQPACRPQPTAIDMHGYYFPSIPAQYCVQYQRYGLRNEQHMKPPIYTAFYKGDKLVEVYSPTAGRGFNPRYNSLLIEPSVQAFLPPITGLNTTLADAMADLHTFHHMAVEFNIPT